MATYGKQDDEILLDKLPIVVWDLVMSRLNNLQSYLCASASSVFFYNLLKPTPNTQVVKMVKNADIGPDIVQIKPYIMKNGVKYPVIIKRWDRVYVLCVGQVDGALGFESFVFQSRGSIFLEDSINTTIKFKKFKLGATVQARSFKTEPSVLELDGLLPVVNIESLRKEYEADFGETAENDMKINCRVKIVYKT